MGDSFSLHSVQIQKGDGLRTEHDHASPTLTAFRVNFNILFWAAVGGAGLAFKFQFIPSSAVHDNHPLCRASLSRARGPTNLQCNTSYMACIPEIAIAKERGFFGPVDLSPHEERNQGPQQALSEKPLSRSSHYNIALRNEQIVYGIARWLSTRGGTQNKVIAWRRSRSNGFINSPQHGCAYQPSFINFLFSHQSFELAPIAMCMLSLLFMCATLPMHIVDQISLYTSLIVRVSYPFIIH